MKVFKWIVICVLLLHVASGCSGGADVPATQVQPVSAPLPEPTASTRVFLSPEDERAQSETNMKQLALSVLQYTQDYDEKFPDLKDTETFRRAVMPYVLNNKYSEDVFLHPRTSEPYQPNAQLSGKSLGDISMISEAVMLYELTPTALGTRGVIFTDGHFKRVAATDWEKLQATLQKKKVP